MTESERTLLQEIGKLFGTHERQDAKRYQQLEERLAGLERQLSEINGTVRATKAEVGPGYPDYDERGKRRTIRDRLHELENDREAARVAQHALTLARESRSQTWSRWQKNILFLFVAVAAISGLLRVFGVEVSWHP